MAPYPRQDNAVGPYEFLDDRILAAANYFWQYMLGYDTPWVPVPYSISPDGTVRGIYQNSRTLTEEERIRLYFGICTITIRM